MIKRLFYRFKNQFICKECTLIDKSKRRYPDIPMLNERLLKNCKVVGHRDQLLQYLPKNSVCAEIGIETGKTSKKILEILQPSKLHLIEINEAWIENAKQLFPKEVASNKVILHHGSSFEELSKFEDNYFDWLYIDGDHRYDGVKKDLELARLKTKYNGLIWLHDYIFYDHISHEKYGVIEAANEMCLEHDYEIVYFALHHQMFNSVVLKKISNVIP